MNIVQRVEAIIKGKQKVWGHDRGKSVGASETFACLRRGWFAKHHPELGTPITNWGVLERGNVVENLYVVPLLSQMFGPDNCLYMGDDQKTFVKGQSSATPDGLILNQPRDFFADDGLPDLMADSFMCEIKSFDPRMNLREEKMIHRGQSQMQLGHVHANTEYRPEHTVILYINASDFLDIRPFFIRRNPDVFTEGQKRSDLIFSTTNVEKLMPEGKYTDQCRYCPFTSSCSAADIRVFPTQKKKMSDNELAVLRAMAHEYDAARDNESTAAEEKGRIAATIKQTLTEMQSKGVSAEDFSIVFSKMSGKASMDNEALEKFLLAHGSSLEEFQKHGDDFTKLSVTIKGA